MDCTITSYWPLVDKSGSLPRTSLSPGFFVQLLYYFWVILVHSSDLLMLFAANIEPIDLKFTFLERYCEVCKSHMIQGKICGRKQRSLKFCFTTYPRFFPIALQWSRKIFSQIFMSVQSLALPESITANFEPINSKFAFLERCEVFKLYLDFKKSFEVLARSSKFCFTT